MEVHCETSEGTVILELSQEDVDRWNVLRERESRRRLKSYEDGFPLTVTDQSAGDKWVVRTAACGLGCRCSAKATKEGDT